MYINVLQTSRCVLICGNICKVTGILCWMAFIWFSWETRNSISIGMDVVKNYVIIFLYQLVYEIQLFTLLKLSFYFSARFLIWSYFLNYNKHLKKKYNSNHPLLHSLNFVFPSDMDIKEYNIFNMIFTFLIIK